MRRALIVPSLAIVAALTQSTPPVVKTIAKVKGVEPWYSVSTHNRVYYTDADTILWMVDRSGGSPKRVWQGQLDEPVVSRAGDRLAFTRANEKQESFIWTMPLDPSTGVSAGPAHRVSLSPGFTKSISPDGRRLAYGTQTGDSVSKVVVMPIEGGRERVLASVAGDIRLIQWSSDGRMLYYGIAPSVRRRDVVPALYRVPADSGRPETVLQPSVPAGVFPFIGLSPDGTTLVTVSDVARRHVVLHNLSGKRLTEFTVPDGHWLRGSFTGPTTLLTSKVRVQRIVVALSLEDGRERVLTDGAGTSFAPLFSPDGRRIAYFADRDGRPDLVVINADGTGKRTLTLSQPWGFGGLAHGFQWSPDGQYLMIRVTATEGGGPLIGIEVIDVTTGRSHVIRNPSIGQNAHWLSDPQQLFYFQPIDSTRTPQRWRQQLHVMRFDGTQDRIMGEVTTNCPYCIAMVNDTLMIFGRWDRIAARSLRSTGDGLRLAQGDSVASTNAFGSPDGRWASWFVGSQQQGWEIELVRTDGTQRRRVAVPGRIVPGPNFKFSADSRELTVLALGEKDGDVQVLRTNVASGDLRRVATIERAGGTMREFSFSADGRTLLYVRTGETTAELGEVDIAPLLRAPKRAP
jgi:Tol biopolymer transport system component